MMLHDENDAILGADLQDGLIVRFLIIGVLAIATGVLAATLFLPPRELGEAGQRIATSEVGAMGSNSVMPQ
jgi:hypothetical protein